MRRSQKKIGEILVKKGLIDEGQLESALEEQKRTKEFFGEILLKRRQIKELDLIEALSEQFDIPIVTLANKYIDWGFVGRFSPTLILDYKCIPLNRDEWSVTVAIINPLDTWVLKKAEEETGGLKLKLVLVSKEDMEGAIKRYKRYIQRHP